MCKSMTIHLILPSKETFTERNAGAVARIAHDFVIKSRFRDTCLFIGSPIEEPALSDLPFKSFQSWHRFIWGRNLGLGKAYLSWLKTLPADQKPKLIEVHGRCALAGMIAKAVPDIPVALILYNDPRGMKGARTVQERTDLCQHLHAVCSISDYLDRCFKDGLDTQTLAKCQFHVTLFGADRPYKTRPTKKKNILLVGRMVPEKGVKEAAEAVAEILPDHPDWRFQIIGARRFEQSKQTPYERAVQSALDTLGDQAQLLGFMPLAEVNRYQAEAEIILVPSQWQEPAGRVVIEALVTGAALITSRRGGIPEYAEGRAIILEEPDAPALAQALSQLLDKPDKRKALQDKAWSDYPFTHSAMAADMDKARHKMLA